MGDVSIHSATRCLQCRVTSCVSCSVALDAIAFLASDCSYYAHLFALQKMHDCRSKVYMLVI